MKDFKVGVLAKYQYVGKYHTSVRIINSGEKVTVQPGDVIESRLDPHYYMNNHFIELGVDNVDYQKAKETLDIAQKDYAQAQAGKQSETMTLAEAKKYCEDHKLQYHARSGDAKIIKLALDHKNEAAEVVAETTEEIV